MALETIPCPLGCQEQDEFVVTGHDLQHGLPGDCGPYVGMRILRDAKVIFDTKAHSLPPRLSEISE